MEIKEKSREFSKKEIYLMTMDADTTSIKEVEDGTKILVDGYLIYTDINQKDGTEHELISVITPDKKVYVAQSDTFKRELVKMFEVFGEDGVFSIIKKSGATNNGREYVTCVLDKESIKD